MPRSRDYRIWKLSRGADTIKATPKAGRSRRNRLPRFQDHRIRKISRGADIKKSHAEGGPVQERLEV